MGYWVPHWMREGDGLLDKPVVGGVVFLIGGGCCEHIAAFVFGMTVVTFNPLPVDGVPI